MRRTAVPPVRSMLDGNSDAPLTVGLAFPAAVAQLCVRHMAEFANQLEGIPERPGIYAIVNRSNGHRYVGQAKNMRARLRSHLRSLEKGTHHTSNERLLQLAWDRFGRDGFDLVVLEEVWDNSGRTDYHERPDNLSLAEHYYINLQSEYNADKRIVRPEFNHLIEEKAWRENEEQNHSAQTTGFCGSSLLGD